MPDCATWWFDHVGRAYYYAIAVRQKDEKEQAEELERLVDGAEEWGRLTGVPEAGPLMTEHVAATKALVDAAFAGDPAAVDQAVDALLANAARQTALYAEKIQGFPAEEWDRLFTGLVSATGSYVLALAAGDAEDFKRNVGAATAGRNALARLWGLLSARRQMGR